MRTYLTLDSVVAHPCADRIVAISSGMPVSHREFRQLVAAWRDAFSTQTGTRWAVYFDDALTFAASLFGAWYAGKFVYLCSDNLPATLHGLHDQVDGFAGDVGDAFKPLQPAAMRASTDAWPPLDTAHARIFVHTSGSTGEPVLIEKRLRQLAHEVDALERTFGALCGSEDVATRVVVHGTVSHQHIYGLLFRVLWPLAAGRPFSPRLFGHAQLAGALGEGSGVLVASPAHLKRLPADLDWSAAQRHLRAVFSSGGPLDNEGAAHARSVLAVAPIEILGSSETGGIAFRRRAGNDADAKAWSPLPGVEWRIGDGRLEVRSAFLQDSHWLRTDDRATGEGEAGFRLLGRGDRIVKIEERRVSLTALEAAIAAHPLVQDIRVVTVEGVGGALAAVMVPTEAGWQQLEALGRWRFAQSIRIALAPVVDATLHPQRWRYVRTLPINAQGKVTLPLLQSLFGPAPDAPSTYASPHSSSTKDPR